MTAVTLNRSLKRYAVPALIVAVAVQMVAGFVWSFFPSPHHASGPAKPVRNTADQLATNGDFERGINGWYDSCNGCGQPALVVDPTMHKVGSASLKVAAFTELQTPDYYNVLVAGNTVYRFSTWIYQRTGGPVTIRLRCAEDTGPTHDHIKNYTVPNRRWTNLELTFETSAKARTLTDLEIMNMQSGPLTYWIDGVRLDPLGTSSR